MTAGRHAAQLRPLLVGQQLVAVYRRGVALPALAGARVLSVEARGLDLVIALDRDASLEVHLGLGGGWRRARRPLPEDFALRAADLALVTDGDVFLCRARRAELVRAAGRPRR
jgi:formamidopyrimidine-DNA glycosylase